MNTRTGKIARLPEQARQLVNQMLSDGARYHAIISRLAELGHTAIRPANLSLWRKGGFQDWLRQQERLHQVKTLGEFVVKQKEQNSLTDTILALTASRLCDAALKLDAAAWIDDLKEEPGRILDILKTLVSLAKQSLEFDRVQDTLRSKKEVAKPEKLRPGLSPETLKIIREKLRLY